MMKSGQPGPLLTVLLVVLITIYNTSLPGARANEIPLLEFNCIPCVAFGGYYCYDDPWVVNHNGDKCYEYEVDVLNCDGFGFTNNVTNCTEQIFNAADKCNTTGTHWEEWMQPAEFNVTLTPRSSCGVEIYGYSSTVFTSHKWPLTLYYSLNNTKINHTHVEDMIWPGQREVEQDCLNSVCNYTFEVFDSTHYFYLANWDMDNNQTITFKILETSARTLAFA